MAVLLLPQLGAQRGTLGIRATQLGFSSGTLDRPALGHFAGIVAFLAQQFDFTAQRGKIGLLGGIGLPQIADLITAGIQLRVKAFLSHLRHAQTLVQQSALGLTRREAPLHVPKQCQQWQSCCGKPQ